MYKNIVQRYSDAMKILNIIVGIVCALILSSIFIAIVIEIFGRNLYRVSYSWVMEFAQFGLIYIVLLGGSILFSNSDHITITFIPDLLSPRNVTILNVVFNIICLFFLQLMFRSGYSYAMIGKGVMSGSGFIELIYPRLAIPIGAITMSLQVLNNILISLVKLITYSPDQWKDLKDRTGSHEEKVIEKAIEESEEFDDEDKE